jgi:two-component system cell cycle sensor histidine kinase PleC
MLLMFLGEVEHLLNHISRTMSFATSDPLATPAGPDKTAARRRRVAALRVREVRDRLTSTSGTRPAFDYELLRQYAQNRLSGALGVILLACAVGFISTFWSSVTWAGLWVIMVLAIELASMMKCREFLLKPANEVAVRRARFTFVLLDLLFGLAWMINLVRPANDSQSTDIINVFVVLLVVAVTSMLGASLPIAVFATTAPLTIAIAISYMLLGTVNGYVLAGLALTALCYFGMLANRLYSSNLAMLEARAEKDALIGELEQAKAKSDEARRHAEAANIAKSRFLAQMSHELRTPLNAILGFSEVMKNELFGAHAVPAYKDYANDIHNSGVHLLGLINEILDLSRIEAGRYELNEEAVALVQVAEECHHLLKLRATHRNIAIYDLFEPDMPRLWADERAARQICLNLLSNAIKFTPQGGEIWLKVGWTAAGGQYLSVKDTGPGIPENEIPIVLDTFGQGSNAIKSAEQGAGLGLPIVKSLIELHGGTFSLKSKLREGTEVIVTFPPERVMAALEPVVETSVRNIFDPPPTEPRMPERDEHGAIGGFLASINFGRARSGRAKTAPQKAAPQKAATHAATHLAILLVGGHLLASHGAAHDRAALIAAAHGHNWYYAESRAVVCREAPDRREHAETVSCTVG